MERSKAPTNAWLDLHTKRLEVIKRTLTEYSFKSSYGGNIPLEHIIDLLNGSTTEILRLQALNNALVEANVELSNKNRGINQDSITDA